MSDSNSTDSTNESEKASKLNIDLSSLNCNDPEDYKNYGNDHFKNNNFESAIFFYSKAIEMKESEVYYSNRSICYLKTEKPGLALEDAKKAIDINPKYVKAYYRRGAALLLLNKYMKAVKDFESVVKLNPTDNDAKQKLKTAKSLAMQQAIHKDGENPSFSLNPDDYTVEESYDGPVLDGEVTYEFCYSLARHMKAQKKLHTKFLIILLNKGIQFLKDQRSIVQDIKIEKDKKITVCGDTHGQYYDLLNIFELNGNPSAENPYLFNGDFVDRGSFSVEVMNLLLAYVLVESNPAIAKPCLFLNRGNHESFNMNQMYGFQGEVKHKYSEPIFKLYLQMFGQMPICSLLNGHTLVVHGGVWKDCSLEQFRKLQRPYDPPTTGPICDALWSDPGDERGYGESPRGTSFKFGPDVTKDFCEKNNLKRVIRSHEMKMEGFENGHEERCQTVFSAPNYCDSMKNKGAYIVMTNTGDDFKREVKTFSEVPHPPVRAMAYAGFGGLM